MPSTSIRNACASAAGTAAIAVCLLALPAASQAATPLTLPTLDRGPLLSPQPAPPTAAQIANASVLRPNRNRKVFVRTTDRAPGGYLEADISWSGRGPYSGRVYGSVHDVEADGYCVGAWMWTDGAVRSLHPGQACPKGDARSVYRSYKKKWRVLVRVCLEDRYYLRYCSAWK